ncbi:blastula protease 10-like, partial [Homarus americanus]|uniref:blastula protease 10-like n=1 Tax=Homarus americanus TaxID=6706 RepID=UPI001C4924A9
MVNNQVEDGRNLPWQVSASLVPGPQELGNQAAKYVTPYVFADLLFVTVQYFTDNGDPTIVTNDPSYQGLIGQREGLSHYDKLLANRMYSCIDKWLVVCGLSSDPCQNLGYTGADCSCVCPPHTDGVYCESVIGSYYDEKIDNCSQVITEEGNITSPDFPGYVSGLDCPYQIIAPVCHVVQIVFTQFHLYRRDNNRCYFDYLIIMIDGPSSSEAYCDQEIAVGTSFTSVGQELNLFFQTRTNYYEGWSAEVTFIPVPGCDPSTSTTTTTTT